MLTTSDGAAKVSVDTRVTLYEGRNSNLTHVRKRTHTHARNTHTHPCTHARKHHQCVYFRLSVDVESTVAQWPASWLECAVSLRISRVT